MTCADLRLSWKELPTNQFCDDGNLQVSVAAQSHEIKISLHSSRFSRQKHEGTKEPVYVDGHISIKNEGRSQSAQNGKVSCEFNEFQDRAALLHLIKTCGKRKDLNKGSRIHADIIRRGLLESDVTFGNALLSMYANCGTLVLVHRLFDQLPEHDIVTWNALICGCAQHGQGSEALSCLKWMQDEGMYPDVITYICLLKACGSIRALEMGEKLHADLGRQGLLEIDVALGTALMDMYVKCGELGKARMVFEMLPLRDVAAWNVIICGYAQQGFNEDALRCFRLMQDEGLSPNAITFVCILKACGNAGTVEEGEEIHAKVDRHGFLQTNLVLGTALVDMYSKCGALSKAQSVFDQLPSRNVVTWNALLAGYVHHGLAYEALKFFEQMSNEGIFPDIVTFLCILKACASIQAVKKGEKIHAEISRQGLLEKENVLGTGLVDMYGKCGALDKAQGVFDKLLTRDVASWTALISGYAEHGHSDEALRCFKQMQDEGLSPDRVAFICILKACGNIGAIDKGEEIHAEVSRQGLLKNDSTLGTVLMDMYAKCGALSKAQGVFDKLPMRNSVTWNALISGYVQHGFYDEAISCFRQMRSQGVCPDTVSVACILQACGRKRACETGEEILAEIGWQDLWKEESVLGNALVNMYARSGMLAKAQDIFEKLPKCEEATWNALIAGYSQHGFLEEALSCFQKMKEQGVSPDAVTFVHILKACGNTGASELGDAIHAEINQQAIFRKDNVLGTALVDMYAKCGKLVEAAGVFDKLASRDVVAWNAMISGFTEHGLGNEAIKCFSKMKGKGISPNAVTFASVLKACGCIAATEKGEEIHAEVGSLGLLETDILTGTAVIDMYAKCGMLTKAQAVFDKLPVRDVVTWNALIAGYVQQGLVNEALDCFGCMQQEEVIFPNAVTFLCILKACGIIGALEVGKEIHTEIGRQGLLGNERQSTVGTALVDMYAKCGMLTKAEAFFNELPTRSVSTWNALMAGYARVGKVEMVFNSFNNMLRECIAPDVITFVILLNACSHAGLVEEGQKCFGNMTTIYNISPDWEHFICIVDLFGRAGNLNAASSIIGEVPFSECDVLWSVLMGACRSSRAGEFGAWVFEHVVQLDVKYSANFVCMSNIYAAASVQEGEN